MRRFSLVSLAIMHLLAVGCTMPRIMILSDPLSPEEHIELGIVYERKGELDNAIREYKAAAKKNPVAYYYLGNAHFQKGDLDKAEGYYKKALENEVASGDAYNNLAWLYYVQRKNLDEAESLALKAMEFDASKRDAYGDTLEKIRELKRSNR